MKALKAMLMGLAVVALAALAIGCGGGGGGTETPIPPPVPENTPTGDEPAVPAEPGAGVDDDDFDGDGIPDNQDLDVDGDGINADDGDCNDLDATINPDAEDRPDYPDYTDSDCDGVDGDLDGAYWVATDGNNANPGTINKPFATIEFAVAAAASDPNNIKDVYIVEGQYTEDVVLTKGVGLYGGFGQLVDGTRERNVNVLKTMYKCDTANLVIVGSTNGENSIIEGMEVTGNANIAAIAIFNASPEIRYNAVYGTDGSQISAAIAVAAFDHGEAKPYIHNNFISTGNVFKEDAGTISAGIYMLAVGDDSVIHPTIDKNFIQAGFGGYVSVGISMFARENAVARLSASKNKIYAGGADMASIAIILGIDPAEEDGNYYYTSAAITKNELFGGSGKAVNYGILSMQAKEELVVANNFITGGDSVDALIGGVASAASDNVSILNNSINQGYTDDNAVGILITSGSSLAIDNNIFYSESANDYGILDLDGSSTISSLRNNLFEETLGTLLVGPDFGFVNDIDSLNNLAALALSDNNISGSALFADVAGYDYHLSKDSGAIDAGLTLDKIADDIDGHARPSGEGFDIGADETVFE